MNIITAREVYEEITGLSYDEGLAIIEDEFKGRFIEQIDKPCVEAYKFTDNSTLTMTFKPSGMFLSWDLPFDINDPFKHVPLAPKK